jgi:hypothetical protein
MDVGRSRADTLTEPRPTAGKGTRAFEKITVQVRSGQAKARPCIFLMAILPS